ncbi:MAG: hypothetical protein IMW89_03505 [Ktedonobacteraceae bacterium]|nr:hypothetical protein [Ktedonobacteraceae bacterium]
MAQRRLICTMHTLMITRLQRWLELAGFVCLMGYMLVLMLTGARVSQSS